MFALLVRFLTFSSSYSLSSSPGFHFHTRGLRLGYRHNKYLTNHLVPLVNISWSTTHWIQHQQLQQLGATRNFSNQEDSKMAKKAKFYAVKKGRKKGIYRTWDECKNQTNGYRGAIFKSFQTMTEAQTFIGTEVEREEPSAAYSSLKNQPNKQNLDSSKSKTLFSSASSTSSNAKLSSSANSGLSIDMYFDGGSRGNPGLGGSGAHIIVNNNIPGTPLSNCRKVRHFCGRCTNNIAEYSGLVEGLKQIYDIIQQYCDSLRSTKQTKSKQHVVVNVRGDSNLIINQMNGNYAVKNEELRKKYNECIDILSRIRRLIESFDNLNLSLSFDHVYRDQNTVADSLANEAMDAKKSWITEGEKI